VANPSTQSPSAQLPATHCDEPWSSGGHGSQPPQCSASDWSSAHSPSQHTSPPGHAQGGADEQQDAHGGALVGGDRGFEVEAGERGELGLADRAIAAMGDETLVGGTKDPTSRRNP